MLIGKGTLVFGDGRKIPLSYEFGSNYDDTRAGLLLCDTAGIDPVELHARLRVICEDGTEIVVAVMHSSDRYLAITGRVVQPPSLDDEKAPPAEASVAKFKEETRRAAG